MKKLILTAALDMLAAFGAVLRNDATVIETLQAKLTDLQQAAVEIQNQADAEERNLSEEEEGKIADILAEFKAVEKDIERRQTLIANSEKLNAPTGRKTAPNDATETPKASTNAPAPGGRVYREPVDHASTGRHGFNNFGEFAKAVIAGCNKTAPDVDNRLIMNAPTTYGNEGVGAEGGFAVPPEFRNEIMGLVEDEEDLMGLTDQLTTSSNSLTIPTDETTPWQSSGGIQCSWDGEGTQGTQSKPDLKENNIRLNKLRTLIPVTEELLSDASAIDSYLRRKAPSKMAFKISDAIINGTGAGMPLGFMNSGALLEVGAESGQTADTVVFENIVNMWARMYGPSRRNAVWLINQDIEPQLDTMGFPTAATAVPMYMPPGGLADSPYGRMKGRPVITTQAAQTLGDKGDIMLVDLNQYMTIRKTMGIEASTSIHLWFDYDTVAFKFIMRMSGQPYLSAPIDPLNGSNTLSPFVTLAERA